MGMGHLWLNRWDVSWLHGWAFMAYMQIGGAVTYDNCCFFWKYAQKMLVFRGVPFPVIAWPQASVPLNSWPVAYYREGGTIPHLVFLLLASYPGHVGGVKQPGIDCLRMCDHFQKNLRIYRAGSYAVLLLVSPFVSLTVGIFISLSECCSVVALFSALYIYILVLNMCILFVYYSMCRLAMWTLQFYGNIVEIATHAHAYDTRPFLSSYVTWAQGYILLLTTTAYM